MSDYAKAVIVQMSIWTGGFVVMALLIPFLASMEVPAKWGSMVVLIPTTTIGLHIFFGGKYVILFGRPSKLRRIINGVFFLLLGPSLWILAW